MQINMKIKNLLKKILRKISPSRADCGNGLFGGPVYSGSGDLVYSGIASATGTSVAGNSSASATGYTILHSKEVKVHKFPVITLCGSTRFKDAFIEEQKRLTLAGNIVLTVGLFGHSGDNEVWEDNTKALVDDIHKQKIDMSDGIFVINVGGYIGESTANEIAYAITKGKTVEYLETQMIEKGV